MPTFLVTDKMNPALAARVTASVLGSAERDTKVDRAQRMRRVVAIARLVLVVTVGYGIWSAVTTHRKNVRELEQARASLLDVVKAERASLSEGELGAAARAEAAIVRMASGPFEGELVDAELRREGLAATLGKPLVYMRGNLEALRSAALVAAAAGTSAKDPLLLCLLEPPAARAEAALLEKVRVAYAGGAPMEARTASARRLDEAVVGLPFLAPAWSNGVIAATEREDIVKLRAAFERAPIARAKEAAKATLLLLAIDEPSDGRGPTELDGERPHAIRVALVDLAKDRTLLRTRHAVDPTWISAAKRPTYARGLDACALAFDVHEDVKKQP